MVTQGSWAAEVNEDSAVVIVYFEYEIFYKLLKYC